MKIERTHDMHLVKQIMMHPRIWEHIHEDGINEAEPVDHEGFYWMLISDDKPLGVFLLHSTGAVCMEMHTCLLPEAWGEKANQAAGLLRDYVFYSLGQKKLITKIPAYNVAAYRYAVRNGMKKEGINRSSFLKNGKLLDQILLGLTLEDWENASSNTTRSGGG